MTIGVVEELLKLKPGDQVDVVKFRAMIHDEFDVTESSDERGALLRVFTVLMDHAERALQDTEGSEDRIALFRKTRGQDYCPFLVKESTLNGNVSSEILDEVTRQEIAAGRMSPDHKLRELAMIGTTFGIGSREQLRALERHRTPSSWWERAMAWLGRR